MTVEVQLAPVEKRYIFANIWIAYAHGISQYQSDLPSVHGMMGDITFSGSWQLSVMNAQTLAMGFWQHVLTQYSDNVTTVKKEKDGVLMTEFLFEKSSC